MRADGGGIGVMLLGRSGVFQTPEKLVNRAARRVIAGDGLGRRVTLVEAVTHHLAPEFQSRQIRFGAARPRAAEVEHCRNAPVGVLVAPWHEQQVAGVEVFVGEAWLDDVREVAGMRF